MATGLVALLDDVAAIAKLAAASLDDVAAAAGKASTKAAGVVIDDTAVTPRYVTGLSPQRELPIIFKIARGSLFNKLVILLPVCLLLSAFAPWALTPLLMIGASYLCFEGAEKVLEWFGHHDTGGEAEDAGKDAATIENEKVKGAIRTDFILSAEIMAIALAEVADRPIWLQGAILALVAVLITIGVYGVVGLIVKMDDVGVHLASRQVGGVRAIGRGLVKGMPKLLAVISTIGTLAMLWVGGGILIHGIEGYGFHTLPEALHHGADAAGKASGPLEGFVAWLVNAAGSAVVGILVGGIIVAVVHLLHKRRAH